MVGNLNAGQATACVPEDFADYSLGHLGHEILIKSESAAVLTIWKWGSTSDLEYEVVHREGLEPPTAWFEAKCSIH